jgi:septum site-determining protein MinC
MPQANNKLQLIEFKGITLPVVASPYAPCSPTPWPRPPAPYSATTPSSTATRQCSNCRSSATWRKPTGARTPGAETVWPERDWRARRERGTAPDRRLRSACRPTPAYTVRPQHPPRKCRPRQPPAAEEPVATAAPTSVGTSGVKPTLFVDRPLRSGQQVYARGGDLVVLAAVNAGAEVIADGSIHIYAPLRGRALAGASGAPRTRAFSARASMPNWSRSPGCIGHSMPAFQPRWLASPFRSD